MNPNIDAGYWWLTAITLPLWVSAVWWNLRAVRHGVAEGVRIRAATAVLAAIYLAGNVTLLFTDVNPAAWSMRGFMLLSIPIVWELPARLSVRMGDRLRDVSSRTVDREEGL